ncbi:NrfD/PsrC family molybdoenzyme membrane anchor subunit [Desulfitobacterium chlororespirans]|uniref:Ni/Fe-hydrogenase 2 integral membrane subunit HybB n=1 Tax=Desulfitobacterium chlororespirans DSM 11544 TaxID=1121395 RepID=A0A1M7UCW1_9FIRM|nr:NrfD/PsrC family molybdoenzyme membrane anchor subunit [Desulfitobacterium chlororespirans]SHN80784.1 Ni/Fe-hydrogenase 2 integral membrane subunit HybB [Desulfitobacterium chlororespirans DSM 11544]
MTVQTKTAVQTTKTTSSNLWNMIFAAVAVLGAVCWGLQLTQGLQVTNLGLNNMWGLYIVGFMIFTGVAAGSLLFAAVPYLFKLAEFKPYTRIAAYLGAVSSIVAASLFIIVDIGNPERAWLFITSGNLTSPMFWDFLMLASYMVISIIFTRQLMLVHEGKKDEESLKPIALIAFIAGLLVTVTSFVFCFQIARPLWNTPVQPLSFLIAALVAALSVQMILATILNKGGYIEMPMKLMVKMAKGAAVLLCIELIIIVGEILIGLYPGGGEEHAAFLWLVSGEGAVGFWAEMVTLVAAIVVLAKQDTPSKAGGVVNGAILALVAIYLIKSNLLQAQLFNPLITYAGPPVYGGTTGPYVPSLIEIGLSLGIISLGALLLSLGLSKLNLGMGK